MTDTVDALARGLEARLVRVREYDAEPWVSLEDIAAEGLSIVKTADWERAQRIEAAARVLSEQLDAVAPIDGYYESAFTPIRAALREALVTP